MNWKEIKIASDSTHFILNGNKLGHRDFLEVLKFHEPGIAPVLDKSGAFHIDTRGEDLYPDRYSRTFGFYCNRAAVICQNEWFHINDKGERVYSNSFLWTGNYQENICTVRDKSNAYFHIDLEGNRIYEDNYVYAGDFKDGFACVKMQNGLFKHINTNGESINDKSFLDLGIFHKNFATAKDVNGWFHIDKDGQELYKQRYSVIEPFYNGFALVTESGNNKQIIDESGCVVIDV